MTFFNIYPDADRALTPGKCVLVVIITVFPKKVADYFDYGIVNMYVRDVTGMVS